MAGKKVDEDIDIVGIAHIWHKRCAFDIQHLI